MPRYTYECETCDDVFDLVHSMNTKPETREECEKECKLKKLPSNLTIINSKTENTAHKVGTVVKSSIEEFKENLKQEKKRLQNVSYKEEK